MVELNSKVKSYIDISGSIKIIDLSSSKDIRFMKGLPVNSNFTDSAIWVRFRLKNSSDLELYYLEINYPLLDSIEVYVCEIDIVTCQIKNKSGDHERFLLGRDIEFRNFLFRIPIKRNETKEVFLRIQSSGPLIIPLKLWKLEAIFEEMNAQNYLHGAYYGIVLALIIYNLLLYITIRETVYIYYIFHILFIALFAGSIDGMNFEFLWSNYPILFDRSPIIFMPLMIGSLILFTNRFLLLENKYEKIHKSLLGLFILSMILLLSDMFIPYSIMVRVQAAYLILICFYLISISAYMYIKDKEKPAIYYLSALIILLVTIIINRARLFNYSDHNLLTAQGIKIGSIIEMILLSLTLGDFVNVLKEEKIDIQKKSEKQLLEEKTESEKKLVFVKKESQAIRKKEIENMIADWHDNLGGDLVDIIYRLNKFIHSESVNTSDLIGLKRTAEEAVFQLKSRMISGSEMDMIHENLLDGLKLYLIDRYFHADRIAQVELEVNSDDFTGDIISDFKKETLFLICKEISTNDLKYGTGISNWKFYEKENNLFLEINSGSNYDEKKSKGIGMKSLNERAVSLGGEITFSLSEGIFHFVLKIPLS
jgi:hypothetical protein